jgi:hypothetical protein
LKITAALVKEQGVSFAVVAVKPSALLPTERQRVLAALHSYWPGTPIVLMASRSGRPTYYGRQDIVRFLSRIYVEQFPWREWRAA